METYALELAVFVAGLIVGSVVTILIIKKIYKHTRVKDELLKSKRNAVMAQRTLDKFLKSSLDLFGELDTAHRQYVQFLRDTAQILAPREADLHMYLNAKMSPLPGTRDTRKEETNEVKKNLEIEEEPPHVNDVAQDIPMPSVLKSPEIPEVETAPLTTRAMKEISKADSSSEAENQKTKLEI